MKIPPANSLSQSLTVTRTSGDIRSWQPGQQLQATVISNAENGLVNLRVGATILTAQVEVNVRIGEKLALEVISLGDKPLLQIVRNDSLQQLIEAAIRQTLPKQQSQAQLLSDIEALLRQKQLATLPDNVQNALKKLYQSFPDRSSISNADGVRQAFNNSGLFLEARLASQQTATGINLDYDLKAGLLRLQGALQKQLAASQTTTAQRTADVANNTYSPSTSRSGSVSPPVSTETRSAQASVSPGNPGATSTLVPNILKPIATAASNTTTGIATDSASRSTVMQTGAQAPQLPAGDIRPGDSAAASKATLSPGALAAAQRTIPGLPLNISLAQDTMSRIQGSNFTAPFVYPANIPFRLNADNEDSRPSARFSRLDSLTKILTLFLKDADSSLARIQLNQLSQQQIEPEQKQAWLFEIPVKHKDSIDLFQFKVAKDNNNQHDPDEEKTGWTIQISFNIEQLGQVHSKISIHQKQVSIIFWAEQQATTSTFIQHMQTLQHDLEDAGLVVGHLNCIQGQPPQAPAAFINNGMVNEQA